MSAPKRRKSSEMWEFFTPINNDIASCNMCKCKLSYKSTTTNLKKHVVNKHPTVALPTSTKLTSMKCSEGGHQEPGQVEMDRPNIVPLQPDQQPETEGGREVSSTYTSSTGNKDSVGDSSLVTSAGNPSTTLGLTKKRPFQERISSFIPKKMTEQGKHKIDTKLMQLFTLDFQPFRVVEDKGFKDFVHALNPNYQLPSRHIISKTKIPAQYEECMTYIKNEIIPSGNKFCITTDTWTSLNTTNYIALTTHFVNDNFELITVLLECASMSNEHTSQNLANEVSRILVQWNIKEKVVFAVSDNASNIQGALRNILGFKSFGCFAHTLNLLVNDALNVETILMLIGKIKVVVGHFRRSCTSNQKLIECQRNQGSTPLKLIQDVATRWNSTYYMLDRFTKLEAPIRSAVALLDKNLPVLTPDEWKVANQLCKILKPFESVTNTISGEKYATASLVIPLVNGLKDVVGKMCQKRGSFLPPIMEVVMKLSSGLEKRCGSYESSNSLLMSTLLDPRFKHLTFTKSSVIDNAKTLVTNAVAELISKEMEYTRLQQSSSTAQSAQENDEVEGDEFRVWSSYERTVSVTKPKGTPLSRAVIEVQRYLDEDIPDRKTNPLEWWKNNFSMFPHLGELAKEKLCLLATSVPCERLFSKAGLLISDRRNRLSENKAKLLLFLNQNYKLVKPS